MSTIRLINIPAGQPIESILKIGERIRIRERLENELRKEPTVEQKEKTYEMVIDLYKKLEGDFGNN